MNSLLEDLRREGLYIREGIVGARQPDANKAPPAKVDDSLPQEPHLSKADVEGSVDNGAPKSEPQEKGTPEGETQQVPANAPNQDKEMLVSAYTLQAAATALDHLCNSGKEYNEETRSVLERMKNDCANMKSQIFELARV